jgi:hypothetical protein
LTHVIIDVGERHEEPAAIERKVREQIEALHYSKRTLRSYLHWIKRFLAFSQPDVPGATAAARINAFLTHLAVEEHVSASTQNQALAALLFLYRHIRGIKLYRLNNVTEQLYRSVEVVCFGVTMGPAVLGWQSTVQRRRFRTHTVDDAGVPGVE